VVDSSSLEVKRRPCRAKPARLEGHQLLTMLLRHVAAEKRGWRIVRVPSVQEEDRRPRHRAFGTATRDRTRVIKRLKGRLASPGLVRPPSGDFQPQLESLRLGEGSPRPAGRRHRLGQEWAPVKVLAQRLGQLAAARRALRRTSAEVSLQKGQQLLTLQGMGSHSAWGLVRELFGWRACRHGQAVGALRGLTPPPDARGNTADERGIPKAGTDHIRAMALEMAWGWRRVPPASALTPWSQPRFGHGSRRRRRRGIVALARTRLIALGRLIAAGVLPDGAALKAAVPISKPRR
jgi:transposase